jgi:hypothetical protein
MYFAFVDESGTPAASSGGRYLVVAVLVTATTRPVELHVRRARRALHRRQPTSELKAANSDVRVIRQMLEAIAAETCEIFGVVVDKQEMPAAAGETVYRHAVGQAISLAAQQHPQLQVMIDKRYTNARQRLKLEQCIREWLRPIPDQLVILGQADSAIHPGLQAVDFVAWALANRFERGESWVTIIASRIKMVETVSGKIIAALPESR